MHWFLNFYETPVYIFHFLLWGGEKVFEESCSDMGTILCKLFRYILCNIFVAYEQGSKYCVSIRVTHGKYLWMYITRYTKNCSLRTWIYCPHNKYNTTSDIIQALLLFHLQTIIYSVWLVLQVTNLETVLCCWLSLRSFDFWSCRLISFKSWQLQISLRSVGTVRLQFLNTLRFFNTLGTQLELSKLRQASDGFRKTVLDPKNKRESKNSGRNYLNLDNHTDIYWIQIVCPSHFTNSCNSRIGQRKHSHGRNI